LPAADLVLAQDALNHQLLGKALVVVHGAVDVVPEVAGEIEQLGLLLDERFVGAAGQVKGQATALESPQEPARVVDEKLLARQRPVPQTFDAATDAGVETAQILVFVPKRIPG